MKIKIIGIIKIKKMKKKIRIVLIKLIEKILKMKKVKDIVGEEQEIYLMKIQMKTKIIIMIITHIVDIEEKYKFFILLNT